MTTESKTRKVKLITSVKTIELRAIGYSGESKELYKVLAHVCDLCNVACSYVVDIEVSAETVARLQVEGRMTATGQVQISACSHCAMGLAS